MPDGVSYRDIDGTYLSAIPEPFWVRRFRGWRIRWRPACYSCRVVFESRAGHDEHWVVHHG